MWILYVSKVYGIFIQYVHFLHQFCVKIEYNLYVHLII